MTKKQPGMMMCSGPVVLHLPALFLLLVSSFAAQGPRFQCGSTSKCQALAGYVVASNDTTYDAVRSLFQVDSIYALYGANDVNATTPAATKVPANTTIRVPFPCACADGRGISDRRPVYMVKKGEGLDFIAREIFQGLVTYQQIAAANGIANASLVETGQKLWIPLPCSCDQVDGLDAVHLAHVAEKGSTVAGIAREFGTTEATLLRLNSMSDPRSLLAGQALDVPIIACGSSVLIQSPDFSLRVPNGSYALTAGNCVECHCRAAPQPMTCFMVAKDLNLTGASVCPEASCRVAGNLMWDIPIGGMGVFITDTSCVSARCSYAGYSSDAQHVSLLAVVTNQTDCRTPSSGSRPPWSWMQLQLLCISMALLFLPFV